VRGGTNLLKERLFFIDNMRIMLVSLVIVFHLAITYGAPGDWFYYEGSQATVAEGAIYALFLGVSQAFFMGLYFLMSAYFTPGSLDRKGTTLYFRDRIIRLGIPLMIFVLVFDPIMQYGIALTEGFSGSFLSFLNNFFSSYSIIGSGPLWFVEALLIFSAAYLLWCRFTKFPTVQRKFPSNFAIVLFALFLGLVTFAVRIWIPMGAFNFLNFQFGFFPQYIALFIVGIMAYRNNWLDQITKKMGRTCTAIAFGLILLLPVILITGIPANYDLLVFFGGLGWQAVAYAFWEQATGIAIIIALIVLFREKWNKPGKATRVLSANAYGAYFLFAPVIVFLALALRGISMDPMLKFVLISPPSVAICFGLSYVVRKIPCADRVL
jgi:glucan biosynthesis protein C